MKVFIGIIIAIFGLNLTYRAHAEQQLFEYNLSPYPASRLGCEEQARRLGQRFTDVTHKQVYSATCAAESERGYYIRIVYFSDIELNLVSTWDDFMVDSQGTYSSAAQCQANLAGETALFEESTGLAAVVSYCLQDYSYAEDDNFVARIDGFGSALMEPRIYSDPSWGDVDESLTTQLDSLPQVAVAQGVKVASAAFHQVSSSGYLLTIRYYSERYVPFRLNQTMLFASKASCVANLASLRNGFSATSNGPLATYCQRLDEFTNGYNLSILSLANHASFAQTAAPDRFASLAQCEADKGRIIEIFRNQLGYDVFYSLCHGLPQDVHLSLFYHTTLGASL